MAKEIKQQVKIETNNNQGSVCKVGVPAVKFTDLWDAYTGGKPVDKKYKDDVKNAKGEIVHNKGDYVYEDQCAARVSIAIHGVGVDMKSFTGFSEIVNGKKVAMRAEELANWLKRQPFCGLPAKPEDVAGEDWRDKIKDRTGIILFKDYWLRDGEKSPTGDHIDLWNGSRITRGSFAGFIITTLRFTFGVRTSTLFDFSDLGKSTQILFLEIK